MVFGVDIEVKGEMHFTLEEKDDEVTFIYIKETYDAIKVEKDCDLISIGDFIDNVKNLCFTNYDGWIRSIYIGNYKTNLGVDIANLYSGKLPLYENSWEYLISQFKDKDILVDWVNK